MTAIMPASRRALKRALCLWYFAMNVFLPAVFVVAGIVVRSFRAGQGAFSRICRENFPIFVQRDVSDNICG
jgi:hypothetical protein